MASTSASLLLWLLLCHACLWLPLSVHAFVPNARNTQPEHDLTRHTEHELQYDSLTCTVVVVLYYERLYEQYQGSLLSSHAFAPQPPVSHHSGPHCLRPNPLFPNPAGARLTHHSTLPPALSRTNTQQKKTKAKPHQHQLLQPCPSSPTTPMGWPT